MDIEDLETISRMSSLTDLTISSIFFMSWKELLVEKVKFVTLKLKEDTQVWWRVSQTSRVWRGREKISSWSSMKANLMRKYLPFDNRLTLYKGLLGLRHVSKFGQEYKEFDLLLMRSTKPKDEE